MPSARPTFGEPACNQQAPEEPSLQRQGKKNGQHFVWEGMENVADGLNHSRCSNRRSESFRPFFRAALGKALTDAYDGIFALQCHAKTIMRQSKI